MATQKHYHVIGGPVGDRIGRKPVTWGSILGAAPLTLPTFLSCAPGYRYWACWQYGAVASLLVAAILLHLCQILEKQG